jgi:hypothetical protein
MALEFREEKRTFAKIKGGNIDFFQPEKISCWAVMMLGQINPRAQHEWPTPWAHISVE